MRFTEEKLVDKAVESPPTLGLLLKSSE